MIVPTLDSIRCKGVFNRLLEAGRHILLVGPTGTGKSVMINQELRETYTNEDWTFIGMAFSAQTTAGQT
jgi:dynein heavy chain